jgi:virginiamycin A acetyltransferase
MSFNNWLSLLFINAILFFLPFYWRSIYIGRGSLIKSRFIIGRGTGISGRLSVRGSGTLEIGKHCAIGRDVKIITSGHDPNVPAMNFLLQRSLLGKVFRSNKTDVRIMNDAWIGEGAIILPGVVIGNGAIIAAGSVVSRSVGDYEIHGGVPARLIKHRFDAALATRLLEIAWWDWPREKMLRNKAFFAQPVSKTSLDQITP